MVRDEGKVVDPNGSERDKESISAIISTSRQSFSRKHFFEMCYEDVRPNSII